MNNEPITKENITDYLLGSVPDSERDKIEDRLFIDPDFADVVDETENDLIDEYVRAELETSRKNNFEQFFLISERRREKVKLAQILVKKVFDAKTEILDSNSEKVSFWENLKSFFRVPALNFAAAALILSAVLIGGYLLLHSKDNQIAGADNKNTKITPISSPVVTLENKISENTNSPQNLPVSNSNINSQNKNNSPNNTPKSNNLNSTPAPISSPVKNENKPINSPQPTFATILLTPMSRSDDSKILNITKTTKSARLQIVNAESEVYETFRTEITNSAGILISNQNFIGKQKPKSFTILIPAEKLAEGDYEITLSGANADKIFHELNYYRFSIRKD